MLETKPVMKFKRWQVLNHVKLPFKSLKHHNKNQKYDSTNVKHNNPIENDNQSQIIRLSNNYQIIEMRIIKRIVIDDH